VIFVSNLLYGLIALVSAAGAIFFLFIKEKQEGNLIPLVIGIILVVLTIIFGGLFLAGRVNKTEDIHITE
jgi:glucose uptake protein GlcU